MVTGGKARTEGIIHAVNIYEKFRTVGKNRKAWVISLVCENTAGARFDWTNVLGGKKGMPFLGIAEVLSQTDHAASGEYLAPARKFDVRLSNGRSYGEFLYMQSENRRWKMLIPSLRAGKVVYSASGMLGFYRSRTINYHLSKRIADSVEIIGAQLAVLGIK